MEPSSLSRRGGSDNGAPTSEGLALVAQRDYFAIGSGRVSMESGRTGNESWRSSVVYPLIVKLRAVELADPVRLVRTPRSGGEREGRAGFPARESRRSVQTRSERDKPAVGDGARWGGSFSPAAKSLGESFLVLVIFLVLFCSDGRSRGERLRERGTRTIFFRHQPEHSQRCGRGSDRALMQRVGAIEDRNEKEGVGKDRPHFRGNPWR